MRYFLKLKDGTKVSKVEKSVNELALGLKSISIPIVKMLPQDGVVSVEFLIKQPSSVTFSELQNKLLTSTAELPIILGRSHEGQDSIADIVQFPHALISGTTGSGKSTLLHSIICSLIGRGNVKLVLFDPKNVEFRYYRNLKQLLYPVIENVEDAQPILMSLVADMETRYKRLARAGVPNIVYYNARKRKKMPYVVLVIDEFADFMTANKKEFQLQLTRLAQKSRACGIHIIIATQRPSADIVTGTIKANFPARIGFKVTSQLNSRIILEKGGAEKLLGKGDALIETPTQNMFRFQGAYLSVDDIMNICRPYNRGYLSRFYRWMRGL